MDHPRMCGEHVQSRQAHEAMSPMLLNPAALAAGL